jgi:putative ABC transport system substrate-binding protein
VTLAFAGKAEDPADRNGLSRIPMLFNIVADPVGSGITRDYGPTGRSLTGVSHNVPLPVQAKVISDLGVTRVAALFNPAESNSKVTLDTLHELLASHRIAFTRIPVTLDSNRQRSPNRWQKIAERMRKAGFELVYLPSDSLVISRAQAIVEGLHQAGLPTFSATEEPISKAGALMGVISHYSAAGHQAGVIAERILRGVVDAGAIPISTPNRYLFLVNEHSMRELGYYPPIPLLRFAEFIKAAADPAQ